MRLLTNWIDAYLDYSADQESPITFHEWVAISIMGATLGRRIWIKRIKYTIFPNLYIILVAGSAKCKKSTSIKIGENILKGLHEPPMIFAQKITTEALISALHETKKKTGECSGIICADEFAVFLGMDGERTGIIPALTNLYDSPKDWVYHTIGRGKEVLSDVTLSLLAGSTKEWLRNAIPESAIGGGFTSRIIFVYQERPLHPKLFVGEEGDKDKLRESLIKDLNTIRNETKGEVKFSTEAHKMAEEWYEEEFYKVRDAKVEGYFARKHDTMFKIASIISASESSNRVIEVKHLKRAMSLLELTEASLDAIITSVTVIGDGGGIGRVLDMVSRVGKITHTELLRKCWRFANAQDVNLMIRTLLESEEIEEYVDASGRNRGYKRVIRKKEDL